MKDIFLKPDENLLDPKDDAVFKFLFTSENDDSRGALKAFISDFTGQKVEKLTISLNEPPVTFLEDKQIRFDVNCTFDGGHRANVEMCMNPNENEAGRSEFFASRLFVSQPTKGKRYDEIVDAYQISIIDNKELTSDDSILHVYEFYDKENKVSLGGKIHIIHVEIKKFERIAKSTEKMDIKEKWGAYLKWLKDKEKIDIVNELIKKEEGMAMATEALREITADEEIQFQIITAQKNRMDWYNGIACARIEGIEKGISIGKEEGEKIGEKRATLTNARMMLSKKLPIELISEITGLTIEEIERLR